MHLKSLLPCMFTALIACISLSVINVHSLESDADAAITIESDRAEFDRRSGIALYVGNVILQQGSLLIHADQITLFSDQEQRLKKAIAEGKPARFQQLMEGDSGLTKASGYHITYLTQEKNISLLKDAILEQEGNSFSGNNIVYNMVNESVSAKGQTNTKATPDGKQPSGRIKMIIQPAKPVEKPKNEDA
jgi:lipopolysaccharide export system protein LptA